MSEEDVGVQEEVVELSPVEAKAAEAGWRPKDEWDGDPDQWVDAREFVFRGELMDRIKAQTKRLSNQESTIEDLKKALNKLGEMNSKIAEKEYQKAVNDLKRQRVRAVAEGDEDLVLDLEDKIDELNVAKAELTKAEAAAPEEKKVDKNQEARHYFESWVERPENSWYSKSMAMAGAADKLGFQYAQDNPDATIEEVFKYVDKEIRKEFPEKFQKNTPTARVAEPGHRGPSSRGTKKYTAKDLSDDQRRVGKMFVDTGAFDNIQAYVDQLADLGEIG